MYTLGKAEITALIRHIARFFKSGIQIYNSEVLDRTGRKTRRRTLAMKKRFEFHANAKKSWICQIASKLCRIQYK